MFLRRAVERDDDNAANKESSVSSEEASFGSLSSDDSDDDDLEPNGSGEADRRGEDPTYRARLAGDSLDGEAGDDRFG